jgi:squalene-associated FAD-dependent desaturase
MENLGQRLMRKPTVAVIGAGWAGCAAAVELTRSGAKVILLEASRTLGGRARRVEHEGTTLDNGQHILLGAYRETLHLMRTVGLRPSEALLRLPMQMRYPANSGGMDMQAPRLPAPFHMAWAVLRAKGLSIADKLALARFSSAARWMQWQLHTDCTVTELLERFDQTERLVRLMWRPLCIAALNTPPERASAIVFLNVLRDSLGARRHASDMLIPRRDLSSLFPDAAASYIQHHGGSVHAGTQVRSVERTEKGWHVHADNSDQEVDAVIIATPPTQARTLLMDLVPSMAESLQMTYEPITTCYLQYAPGLKLSAVFYALQDNPEQHRWAQFIFDRGQLDASQAGLMAVVISASSEAIAQGNDVLLAEVLLQIAADLDLPALLNPQWHRIISEKRATFSCTPNLYRPKNDTGLKGLFIAGDYTAGDYPATLEGAVRSGREAARQLVLQSERR